MKGLGLAATFCALFLASTSAFADTFTVGPPSSGADFDEIQDAVDAAQNGDVILVFPGDYEGFRVSKGVKILGQDRAQVRLTTGIYAPVGVMVEVTQVPAGEELLISGMTVGNMSISGGHRAMLGVADSSGVVSLNALDIASEDDPVVVTSSALVLVDDVTMLSSPHCGASTGFEAENSEVWITNSHIVAGEGCGSGRGGHGAHFIDSTVYIAQTTIRGGEGAADFGSCSFGYNGGEGILAESSLIKIVGPVDQGPDILGGDGIGGGIGWCLVGRGGHGILLKGSSELLLSTSVAVQGGNGNPDGMSVRLFGGAPEHFDLGPDYPTLHTPTPVSSLGSVAQLELRGQPNAGASLYLAFESELPFFVPGVDGAGVLKRASAFGLASLLLDANGAQSFSVAIPPAPGLLGLVGTFQWVESTANREAFSNPVRVTVAQ